MVAVTEREREGQKQETGTKKVARCTGLTMLFVLKAGKESKAGNPGECCSGDTSRQAAILTCSTVPYLSITREPKHRPVHISSCLIHFEAFICLVCERV